MNGYGAKQVYLLKLAGECSEEIGLSTEKTHEILEGNFDDNDVKAKVGIHNQSFENFQYNKLSVSVLSSVLLDQARILQRRK